MKKQGLEKEIKDYCEGKWKYYGKVRECYINTNTKLGKKIKNSYTLKRLHTYHCGIWKLSRIGNKITVW